MTGLAGWFGAAAHDERQAVADAMARRLAADTPGQTRSLLLGDRGALIVSAFASNADLARDGEVAAAIVGYPAWRDAGAGAGGAARALIEAYRRNGEKLLDRLHGDFAFALIDAERGQAWLAVDRLGIRPLAYAARSELLVFASSLDAISAHPQCKTNVDPRAIFDFFYFSMIPSPATIYENVVKLQPAEFIRAGAGRPRHARYWRPRFEEDRASPPASLARELRALLEAAVRRHNPDCTAGGFLSGGLDSSTVCGYLAQQCPGSVRSYSIGFDVPGYDEMRYARASVEHFKLQGREYYVTPRDVEEAIPRIAQAYDEPFGNSSALPAYYCAKLAREDGTSAMLAGDGGDELFAGNTRYVKQAVFELYEKLPRWLRARVLEPLLLGGGRSPPTAPLRKLQSYVRQACVPLPERLETYNFLHRAALAEIFQPEFLVSIDAERPLRALREVYHGAEAGDSLNRMLALDWKFTLADNDLRKVNRMCHLNGVEARYPMLDDDVVAFSTRVPADLKIRRMRLRDFYKRAFSDFLPAAVIAKPKHGFGLPFGEWLKVSPRLQDLMKDALHAFLRRPYVRREYVELLLYRLETEHAGYFGTMVWKLMVLELWMSSRKIAA